MLDGVTVHPLDFLLLGLALLLEIAHSSAGAGEVGLGDGLDALGDLSLLACLLLACRIQLLAKLNQQRPIRAESLRHLAVAALELNLTDSYRAGSNWSLADGISLADSAAEWTAFEAAMENILGSGNGEVSLLKAITEAAGNARKLKIYSEVTGAVAANNDASGPSNDNNLDTDLGDLSGGTFLQDYDVYLNGELQEGGADASANNDYYPGTALASGQLKFEFTLTPNDKLVVISYA